MRPRSNSVNKIKYRDAYGQNAVAIRNQYGAGWKLTFLRGVHSYSRQCRSEAQVRAVLDANGYCWNEVGRW